MAMDFSHKRVAILGAGKIGGILLNALLEKGLLSPTLTSATVQHEDRARVLSEKLGVPVSTDNLAAVSKADIIFVCVKPQVVQELMEQVRPAVSPDQLVISVAASVSTSQIEKALGGNIPVVRAIQNTGAYTLEAICCALNERSVRPARGTRWYVSSVANLLARAQKLAEVRNGIVAI